MSKRLVLVALLLLAGGPMLASETAPIGLALAVVAAALFALPRLARRAAY